MEGSRRFFRRKSTTSSSRTHLLVKDRRPFGIQTRARGAGVVRPDTNMDGGPFKLPTKGSADAVRKKKVRRVRDASTSRHRTTHKRFSLSTANSHLTSAPHPLHRAGSDRHGQEVGGVAHPDETHQGSHVRRRRLEVRAPIPSFTRTAVSHRRRLQILLRVHVRERSAVCNRTTHAPPTDPHTDPSHTTPTPTHRSYAATPSAPR